MPSPTATSGPSATTGTSRHLRHPGRGDVVDRRDTSGRVAAAAQDRVQRKLPENLAAYECVLAGKLLHHRSSRADNEEAQRLLERAIALDPGYAHAHAWRACVLGQSVVNGWCADADGTVRTVIGGVTLAQSLDENDSDVHRILAAINLSMHHDHDKALFHQERALALNPQRRPHRRAAGRGADLDRSGGTRHRMDPEGDAPQPLPSRAVLGPSRSRLFRGQALWRGDQSVPADQPRRLQSLGVSRRLPRAARRRRRRRRPRRSRYCNGRRTSRPSASSRPSITSTRATANTTAPRSSRRSCRHDLKTAGMDQELP